MSQLLLIDGDQFIFKACAAIEKDVRWDDQNHVLSCNEEEAWDSINSMLRRLFERFDTDKCVLALSSPPNFRLKIDQTYKGNRVQRKPLCYSAIRERIEEKYTVKVMPGLEADDVMGILATKPSNLDRIIVSQDKDMKTIPATVWNGKDLVPYTEAEADYWHMFQTLTGDVSDGYKGCPGMGPKKAEQLLNSATVFEDGGKSAIEYPKWPYVVKAYVKAGLTEEDALAQARLARILRFSDWDAKKKEPILWQP